MTLVATIGLGILILAHATTLLSFAPHRQLLEPIHLYVRIRQARLQTRKQVSQALPRELLQPEARQ